jgi:WD40 repeat protein
MQFAQNRFTGRLQFIDPDGRKKVRELDGCFFNLTRSPDGRRLAAFDLKGLKSVRVWHAETGRALGAPLSIVGPIIFGPEGKELIGVLPDVLPNADDVLVAVDAETGAERFRQQGSARVRSLAATPDGRRVVAGQNDGSVLVLDAVIGKQVTTFRSDHLGGIVALAVRPDGEELITAGLGERTASVRDAATGKERLKLTGHTRTINAVAYSPDGRRILTGSEDHTVKLWDAATGQELVTFLDCTKPVRWVAFSADAKQLAAGGSGADGVPGSEVIVWDAQPLDAPR